MGTDILIHLYISSLADLLSFMLSEVNLSDIATQHTGGKTLKIKDSVTPVDYAQA